jgi:hypothetical protein
MKRNKPVAVSVRGQLQYWNGTPAIQYRISGETRWSFGLQGFSTPCGVNDDIDAALAGGGAGIYEVNHNRKNGGKEVREHWFLGETVALFPLTTGPKVKPSKPGLEGKVLGVMAKSFAIHAKDGLRVRWQPGRGSEFSLLVYEMTLASNGYPLPLVLSAKKQMTEYLFAALIRHIDVCEVADGLASSKSGSEVLPFEMAWHIGCADCDVAFGRTQTATVYPLVCAHPTGSAVDRDYLRGCFLPRKEWGGVIRSRVADDFADAQRWAAEVTTEPV